MFTYTRMRAMVVGAVLVAVIVGIALTGPVLGGMMTTDTAETETVDSTDRTVESTVLSPGESTQVTVDVMLGGEDDLGIVEEFDPAFAEVEILDDDGAFIADSPDSNDELFADYTEVTEVTLLYEITVPDDASDGETYTIKSGNDSDVDLGQTTIEVDKGSAFFVVDDLQPGDVEVESGESVDVSANITNSGQTTEEQTISLEVGDEIVETQPLTLGPEETETLSFTDVVVPEESGLHTYTVASQNTDASGQFEVGETDVVLDRTIENTVLSPGDSTIVTVEAEFVGEEPAIFESFSPAFEEVEVTGVTNPVDPIVEVTDSQDELIAIWSEQYEEIFIEYEVTVPEEVGEHEINGTFEFSNGEATEEYLIGTDTIEVVDGDPPEFVVDEFEAPSNVSQGEELVANASVTNLGEITGTQSIEYRINDTVRASAELELGANNTDTVSFSVATTDLEPGIYDHSIWTDDTNESGVLEIERSLFTYASDDDLIETDGLRSAIADWRDRKINTDLLRSTIEHWRTNKKVTSV